MANHQFMNYQDYSVNDFFEDPDFIRHVLRPDTASISFWWHVEQTYPEKVGMMEEARLWIGLIRNQIVHEPLRSKELVWNRVVERINLHEKQEKFIRPMRSLLRWVGYAAAMFLLVLGIREVFSLGEQVRRADYGKLKEITLPDESVITLNGNSNIRYRRSWKSDKPREIWMDGEAFFQVKHVAVKNRVQEADSFRVYVNGLRLTVLGTKFNVKSRRKHTQIFLEEGSLRIDKEDDVTFSKVLKPGQAIDFDQRDNKWTPIRKKPEANTAWLNREIDLDGYTLLDMVHILEDTYGYQVVLNTPELADHKMKGTIPAENAQDILFVLEKVFNLNITQQSNHLIINHNQTQ